MFVEEFEVATVVLQGDVLAPFLFITTIDFLMKNAEEGHRSWLCHSHPRTSERDPAKIFNDLDFADFCLKARKMFSHRWKPTVKLQKKLAYPSIRQKACKEGLMLDGNEIKRVDDFHFLGSLMVSCEGNIEWADDDGHDVIDNFVFPSQFNEKSNINEKLH